METQEKKEIKTALLCLSPFAIVFAIGLVFPETRRPETMAKIVFGTGILCIILIIIAMAYGLKHGFPETAANTARDRKTERPVSIPKKPVSRSAVQSPNKRLVREYVPYVDEDFDTDDKDTGSDSEPPLWFRRPIGMIPDPYDPKHWFTDIYGHQYHKMYGTWWDDNGNQVLDYMKDCYGLTAYEKQYGDDD